MQGRLLDINLSLGTVALGSGGVETLSKTYNAESGAPYGFAIDDERAFFTFSTKEESTGKNFSYAVIAKDDGAGGVVFGDVQELITEDYEDGAFISSCSPIDDKNVFIYSGLKLLDGMTEVEGSAVMVAEVFDMEIDVSGGFRHLAGFGSSGIKSVGIACSAEQAFIVDHTESNEWKSFSFTREIT